MQIIPSIGCSADCQRLINFYQRQCERYRTEVMELTLASVHGKCGSCRHSEMQSRPSGGTWLCCNRIGEDTPNTCEWFGGFCGAWERKA